MEPFSLRRFGYAVLAFLAVLAVGTIGFHAITDEDWVASSYRAVVTTTLTGSTRGRPEPASEIFTIVLLLAGVAIFLYIAGAIVELIARGVLGDAVGERTKEAHDRPYAGTHDHLRLRPGGPADRGRVHRERASVRRDRRQPAFDRERPSSSTRRSSGATGPRTWISSWPGSRGRGRSSPSADSDEINLFITLSARAARPDLFIVARASDDSAARKLRLAGADRVVQPYSSAGLQMANLVLKPQVAAFLDVVSTAEGEELRFEEIEVPQTCGAVGRTIRELRVP